MVDTAGAGVRTNFVTFGRAIAAYSIALATGAVVFIPLLTVVGGGDVAPLMAAGDNYGLIPYLLFWSRVELGALLFAFALFAIPLSPIYAAALAFFRWKGIIGWIYYAMLGIVMTVIVTLTASSVGQSIKSFQIGLFFRFVGWVALPIGILAGLTSWVFLKLTWSKE